MQAPGGARVRSAGEKMFGVTQGGGILAMAGQSGAAGRGAQGQALAQRPGKGKIFAQSWVQ